MRKTIYYLASIVGVFIAVLLIVLVLMATEAGSRWIVNHVITYVPGKLTIGRIQGSVLSGLNFYEIEQRDKQQHLQIQHVALNFQPMALLGGTVFLRSLNISGVSYIIPETKKVFNRKTVQSSQDISFPFSVVVEEARVDHLDFHQGATKHTLDYVQLAGRADKNGLLLKRFEAQGEDVHVNLQGHISFRYPYPFQANMNWSTLFPSKVKAKGKCEISGNIEFVEFTHKFSKPFELDARGEVKIGSNLTTKDKTTLYDLSLKSDFVGPGLPPTHIETHAQTDLTIFQVDNLIAHTLGGMVKVNGHIVLQPDAKGGELTVNAIDIDPSSKWPAWPGKLAFDAKIQGKIDAGTPTIILNEIKLAGYLLKQSFQGEGNLTFSGKDLAIKDLRIRSGKNYINLDGKATGDLNLRFELNAADPIKLWPGIRGHLQGHGTIKGTHSNPIGTITLEGNNMSYGDYTLQNLEADIFLDSKNTHQSNGRFRLRNLRVADEAFSDLSFIWAGDFKQHRVNVDFMSNSTHGEVEFVGGCHQDNCEFKVDIASFDIEKHGRWHLLDPVTLMLSYAEIKPFKACWAHKKSNVCVQGSWNNEAGWKSEDEVTDAPLKYMIDLFKDLFNKEHLGWEKVARY